MTPTTLPAPIPAPTAAPATAGAPRAADAAPSRWTPLALQAALAARGVRRVLTVQFTGKPRTLYRLTGATLQLAPVMATAPADVVDALAAMLKDPRPIPTRLAARGALSPYGQALLAAQELVSAFVEQAVPERRVTPSDGTPAQDAALAAAYAALNAAHFANRLPPDVPLRWSARMSRTLGRCEMVPATAAHGRELAGLVLNLALALPENAAEFRDTLLHEMAHGDAWLTDGESGHGFDWQRRAFRLGIKAVECGRGTLTRRPTPGVPILDVPSLPSPTTAGSAPASPAAARAR